MMKTNFLVLCLAVIGLSGCASSPTNGNLQVKVSANPSLVAARMNLSGKAVRIESQTTRLCLKRENDFYCGDSHPVTYLSAQKAIPQDSITAKIELWQIGSLSVGGKVIFVVMDESQGALWTLPESLSRASADTVLMVNNDIVTPGCICARYDQRLTATAIISTF